VSRLRDRLDDVRAPHEPEAQERAWHVVSAAFAEREPLPPRRHTGRLVAVALAVLVAAATIGVATTSAGRSIVTEIRRAIGVERAQPALFSLPAPGRLLVVSDEGAWVVQQQGSKRLLGPYRDATWSPNGLFVAGTRANELAALEPDGDVRWTLARRDVRFPRWTGSRTDTRIAYVDRSGIRVVAGDGSDDRLLAPAARGPLAWRPGARHALAFVSGRNVRVQDVDTRRLLWSVDRDSQEQVLALEWSSDGKRLLVLWPHGLRVYGARGKLVGRDNPSDATQDAHAAFRPGTHEVAVVRVHGSQSTVFRLADGRTLFNGTGVFEQVGWSPDGRWLLLAWPTADQLVFVRAEGARRIRAVSNVSGQFRSLTFPRVEGWIGDRASLR
jgi:hypothetical protein